MKVWYGMEIDRWTWEKERKEMDITLSLTSLAFYTIIIIYPDR